MATNILDRLGGAARVLFRGTSWGNFFLSERLRQQQGGVPDNPYGFNPWVYRGLSLIGSNLSMLPTVLERGTVENPQPVTVGPWCGLFKSPNPSMTWDEFSEATLVWLIGGGECFWILESDTDELLDPFEIPAEMWVKPGGKGVQEEVDPRTKLITGWKFTSGKGTLTVPADNVVHFKLFNPLKPHRGQSALQPAAQGIRSDYKAAAWNERFFDNGADAGGSLVSEQPIHDKEVRERLREQYESRHRGYDKAHRVALLEGGVTYQPHKVKHTDMAFLAQREWSRHEVAVCLGLPLWFFGVTADLNRATANAAERILWRNVLRPIASRVAKVIDSRLLDLRDPISNAIAAGDGATGLRFRYDLDDVEALQDDFDQRLESGERLQRMGYGVNVINRRLKLGMPNIEGGETGLLPMGYIPTPMALSGQLTMPLFLDDFDDDVEASTSDDLLALLDGTETFDARGVHALPAGIVRQALPGHRDGCEHHDRNGHACGELVHRSEQDKREDEARANVWTHVARTILDPYELLFNKRIRGYLFTIRGQLLRALKTIDARAATRLTPDEILELLSATRELWDTLLEERTQPLYLRILNAAADGLATELGSPIDLPAEDPDVLEFFARKQVKVRHINGTIRQALRSTLIEGLSGSESGEMLQTRVRGVFNAAASRTFTIARTEVAQTTNGARHLAFEEAGISLHRWITARDPVVRETHQAIDGVVVPVGTPFPNGLRHPSDMEGAPQEIINCRCIVAPVLN